MDAPCAAPTSPGNTVPSCRRARNARAATAHSTVVLRLAPTLIPRGDAHARLARAAADGLVELDRIAGAAGVAECARALEPRALIGRRAARPAQCGVGGGDRGERPPPLAQPLHALDGVAATLLGRCARRHGGEPRECRRALAVRPLRQRGTAREPRRELDAAHTRQRLEQRQRLSGGRRDRNVVLEHAASECLTAQGVAHRHQDRRLHRAPRRLLGRQPALAIGGIQQLPRALDVAVRERVRRAAPDRVPRPDRAREPWRREQRLGAAGVASRGQRVGERAQHRSAGEPAVARGGPPCGERRGGRLRRARTASRRTSARPRANGYQPRRGGAGTVVAAASADRQHAARATLRTHSHSIVAGGLLVHVVDHAIDAAHLVGDPARGAREQRVRQARPVGGHAVHAVHRTQRDHLLVRALVALHAHRGDGQQHRERLPGAARTISRGAAPR